MELCAVVVTENLQVASNDSIKELGELELVLVGGGIGDVVFG